MKNILIYGNNSFLAKNFITKENKNHKLYFFSPLLIKNRSVRIPIKIAVPNISFVLNDDKK